MHTPSPQGMQGRYADVSGRQERYLYAGLTRPSGYTLCPGHIHTGTQRIRSASRSVRLLIMTWPGSRGEPAEAAVARQGGEKGHPQPRCNVSPGAEEPSYSRELEQQQDDQEDQHRHDGAGAEHREGKLTVQMEQCPEQECFHHGYSANYQGCSNHRRREKTVLAEPPELCSTGFFLRCFHPRMADLHAACMPRCRTPNQPSVAGWIGSGGDFKRLRQIHREPVQGYTGTKRTRPAVLHRALDVGHAAHEGPALVIDSHPVLVGTPRRGCGTARRYQGVRSMA